MAFKKGEKPPKKSKSSKTVRKKAKKFTYAAPSGMKPFFLQLLCRVGKDGLINDVEGVRFKGRPDNPKAKKVNLSETDPKTLIAIASRLGGTSFVTNPAKRLPAKAAFQMTTRVGANKEGDLRFTVREIRMKLDDKTKTLKKKDPIYRRLRRCARIMPGAFMKVGDFPKASKKKEADDE